jgi:hypothetical protein
MLARFLFCLKPDPSYHTNDDGRTMRPSSPVTVLSGEVSRATERKAKPFALRIRQGKASARPEITRRRSTLGAPGRAKRATAHASAGKKKTAAGCAAVGIGQVEKKTYPRNYNSDYFFP